MMKVKILLVGQITDITGDNAIVLEGIDDTDSMVSTLHQMFPALANATYLIAVNKKIISGNTLLTDNCTVALLPPFSGG